MLSCACTYAFNQWTKPNDLTIEDAMRLVGEDLTPNQRSIIISALRREALVAARQLSLMAETDADEVVRFNALRAMLDIGDELR